MIWKLFGLLTGLFLLAACTAQADASPKIHVDQAWARPAVVMDPMSTASKTPDTQAMAGMTKNTMSSAAYFVIVNDGGGTDTLTGVTSPAASQASVHETQYKGDVAQMVPIPSLEIPAHGQVEFKPGSYHVMLEGLTQDLKEGDTIKITLQFQKSGPVTLDLPIRQQP